MSTQTLASVTPSLLDRRNDFPILNQTVRGQRLVYLDNGATTQKPAVVIDAEKQFYEASNANIHRGVHWLSQHATDLYDASRVVVQQFLHAQRPEEIVFTSGTTDSINLVAATWGRKHIQAGDEILLTMLEHHSNIVPWQLLAEEKGATIKVVPILDNGDLDLDAYHRLLSERTKFVGIAHVSNALGTVNPIRAMIAAAHKVGATVLIDGAQAVAHETVDVQALDCDFYVFSGHKIFGPTGTGVLYGKYELLDAMPPWKGGGDMIYTVSFSGSTYAPVPQRFEAGTPNIAGVIVLAEALKYVQEVGLEAIAAHEQELLRYATQQLEALPGIQIIGKAAHKAAVISFMVDDIHPHDLGTILDMDGVAIRAGHHCAMPLMTELGIPGTARASFAFYNNYDDIDALIASLKKAQQLFGVSA
ncbi:MAG TPA: cysteine desulfurase [Candidatus Paenalcaligenes intestinipullorum]|uniref:Cysteine desulfurase n=1 Tax=Candidatus Paenalcaligenes intestinipullorum TaxID=2838718 RepID=A0A9D2RFV9_9BURK|nr:cysteine desulfurase [Candidatus Paenalcaligenes intestinipullorum]